jgi:hypothetical protein
MMLRDRFHRFRPFSPPVVPAEKPQDQGWSGTTAADGEDAGDVWAAGVDLRADARAGTTASVTACPVCHSSMAVEELDLVGRVARLVCGDCGLLRARRLPSLSPS